MPTTTILKSYTIPTGGGTNNLAISDQYTLYKFSGSGAMSGNYTVAADGTPYDGLTFKCYYFGNFVLGSFNITFFGQAMGTQQALTNQLIEAIYQNGGWHVVIIPFFNQNAFLIGGMLVDGTITLGKLGSTGLYLHDYNGSGVGSGNDTTEDVLDTLVYTAATLNNNDSLVIRAVGSFNSNSHVKTARISFGGLTNIVSVNGVSAPNGVKWISETTLTRISSTVGYYSSKFFIDGQNVEVKTGTITTDFTVNQNIVVTGQSGNMTSVSNTNDIVWNDTKVSILR